MVVVSVVEAAPDAVELVPIVEITNVVVLAASEAEGCSVVTPVVVAGLAL